MEILQTFGVQPTLLIAQIVNFLILLFILKKFLYKPILKVLAQRKEKIAQSLKDVEEIEKRLKEANEEGEKIIQKATQQSQKLIEQGTEISQQIVSEGKQAAEKIIEEANKAAKEAIRHEEENLRKELNNEIAKIVTLSLQKITGKILTKKDQQDILSSSIKDIV